jgi:hypothetical protein
VSFVPSTYTPQRHAASRFPLTGAHAATPCRLCHRGSAQAPPPFRFADLSCRSCHDDVHAGQFARGGGTDCERCHTTSSWGSLLFDHDADSRFPLTGGHRGVPCAACHRTETSGELTFTRYRPLSTACETCHTRQP